MGYNKTKEINGRAGCIMVVKDRILSIAICDDEKALCAELEDMLEHVAQQLNLRIEISIWFSGEMILDYIKKGNHIDIIFLDIELLKLSGIELGNYIRNDMNNANIQIVYISSKTNYALKLFKTHPYDFLIKPINESDFYRVMEGLIKILETQNYLFEYQNGREIFRLEYDDILYFKSNLHKVVIVTRDKDIDFYGKLKEVIEHVPPQFLSIHKSYLINMNYVTKYTFDFVEMKNNDILTISKAYQKEVREKLSYRRR